MISNLYIDRIKLYNENIKLIIFLREPVSRAYSQYNMIIDNGSISNNISFFDATFNDKYHVEKHKIISRGFYYEQISYIYQHFPKNNIHICVSEDVLENPQIEYNKIFLFLGAGEIKINFTDSVHKRNYKKKISQDDFNTLYAIYKEYNEKLYNLLGYRIKKWEDMYEKL
jgi:hypothetical protein